MADIDRRLERIERIIGDADCICARNQSALVIIDDDWSDEQKKRAEASESFTCPTHGVQLPKSLIRLSTVDARL